MYLNTFQSIWPQVFHQVPYTAAKFEVATSNDVGGNIFTRKYIIRPLTLGSRSHSSTISARYHTFVEIDHEIISTVILLPSAESFKKGCCQLQAKVCAQITG